ncbi:MAG TPA: NAD-dependent epimerase/dehydratase family protein [Thermoanaerobaculia bacterium]|nr:NAD-dependent epimerase/dehydratase family protein [Thermoanaerobaculia bacterium]
MIASAGEAPASAVVPPGALTGRRVLVTGASGFVGGRLAERLALQHGARVRVLVRGVAGAARVARLPVELLRGDVTDATAMAEATAGCDVVFHCAYGTSGSQKRRAWVNRVGTRRVLAAAAAGVQRVVHLSTLMVYGQTGDGDLDETAPRRRFGNPYSDSKLAAEREAMAWARAGRAPVVVLQPTAVYGPWGGVWTAQPLQALRSGRWILVDDGAGTANAVYVDDLVSAMLLAATREGVVGEAFLVSGPEPATWRELYGRFAAMLEGGDRLVSMSAGEALAFWRRHRQGVPRLHRELIASVRGDRPLRDRLMATRELVALRELASSILPEPWQERIKGRMGSAPPPASSGTPAAAGELPIHPLDPPLIGFFAARTRVRIDKARRLLGYEPAFSLARGMELTEQWARWAGLLEPQR